MTKQEFSAALRNALSGLPPKDIEERVTFYGEMIDDRMEEGVPEEEAVAGVGDLDEIVSQILAETPLTRIVKEKIKPKHSLRAWEIILLVLGFPLWFPLLLVGGVLLLTVYILVGVFYLLLCAVELALALGALGGVATAVLYFMRGYPLPALCTLGLGLAAAGIGIFMSYSLQSCLVVFKWAKKIMHGVKRLFVGKGGAQ